MSYLKTALIAAAVFLAAWTVYIWAKSLPYIHVASVALNKGAGENGGKEKSGAVISYTVIVERDLFKESRRKFIPRPVLPPPVVAATPPPVPVEVPRKPPPRLSLIGTVLLDNTNAAIIEYGGRPATYKIGDSIDDFVIKIINPDYVLMDRDGETLRVGISPASPAGREGAPAQ